MKSSKENVPTPFNSLVLAPSGEFVVNAGRIISLINTGSDKDAPAIWSPDCAFGGAAVSPNGSHISAMSSEERLLVWTLRMSDKPRDLGRADAGVYGATAFTPDGRRIAAAGHVLRMVDVESGNELWALPRNNYVFLTVAFRSDGKTIATGSQDTSIRLWNAETGKEIAILRGYQGYVDVVVFSPDGKKMVSWARDGQLFLWDLSGQRGILGLSSSPRSTNAPHLWPDVPAIPGRHKKPWITQKNDLSSLADLGRFDRLRFLLRLRTF